MNDCIFCKIARGEIASEKIYENDNFFSILDINPEVEGHALVISKRHFATLLDLPSTLGPEMIDCVKNTTLKMMDKQKAGGFNVINNGMKVGGQIVNHVHFHIIPRKEGDKFRCWNLEKKKDEARELIGK